MGNAKVKCIFIKEILDKLLANNVIFSTHYQKMVKFRFYLTFAPYAILIFLKSLLKQIKSILFAQVVIQISPLNLISQNNICNVSNVKIIIVNLQQVIKTQTYFNVIANKDIFKLSKLIMGKNIF